MYTSTTFVTPLRMRTFQPSPIMSRTARCKLLIRSPRPLRLPRAKWWNCHGCSGIIKKDHLGRMSHKRVALQVGDAIPRFFCMRKCAYLLTYPTFVTGAKRAFCARKRVFLRTRSKNSQRAKRAICARKRVFLRPRCKVCRHAKGAFCIRKNGVKEAFAMPWHRVGQRYACYTCTRNAPGSNPTHSKIETCV